MKKKMETTIMGYIGIMEKKMETTIMGHIGFRVLGFWGLGWVLPPPSNSLY